MKVLNYGSLNVDYVYSVDHIIVGGETQHSSKLEVFSGGKGLNQSIALAKAGVPVYHAGIVGSDGDILLDACKEAGVNTKYIRRQPTKYYSTEGTNLYFAMKKDGEPIDPIEYLP